MATTYVILGRNGSDCDFILLSSGYRSRASAQRQMHYVDGPSWMTRTVTTLRWWRTLRQSQIEMNEERENESHRDHQARKKAGDSLRALVCPVAASLADHMMMVGSTHGRENPVPVGDAGLRALVGGRKSIRVEHDGSLDYDSHLLNDGTVEWYENGVRHLVVLDAAKSSDDDDDDA